MKYSTEMLTSPRNFILIYPPTIDRPQGFPIGGIFLAHSLLENGYSVEIINEQEIERILPLLDSLVGEGTIAFGISIFSGYGLFDAMKIAQHLREFFPDIPVIWGGPHVSALPEQTLKSNLVDFIVWGEGEVSLPKLLKAIKNKTHFDDIKGIGYKHNNSIVVTQNVGYTKLDKVFELPYHLLDVKRYYRELNMGGKQWLSGLYSRGCPFKCTFCINSNENWDNSRIRFHNIDHIVSDIETLVNEFGADGVTILDDHFLINENRVIKICRELQRKNINIFFRAVGRIDSLSKMHDDTFQLLKDTGFISIGAGVESGSPRMLRYINKNLTLDEIYYVDSKLTQFGIYKHWNFITALPGETIEDVRLTLELIVKLAKTSFDSPYPFSSYNKYIPLPGTKLFKIAVEQYGLKEPQRLEDWGAFSKKYELDDNAYGESVRPWLKGELKEYTKRAEGYVNKLDSRYTGPSADKHEIMKVINEIEEFIRSSV